MSEFEEKLNTIMSDPQLMGQIMSMAQSLGASQSPAKEPQKRQDPAMSIPDFDPAMLQKLSRLAGQSGIDRDQQALLSALGPYISRDRVSKLERAMRAAKMAQLASVFLGQGGLSILTGR